MSQNNKKNQKFVGVIGISDFINLIEENKKLKERIEEFKNERDNHSCTIRTLIAQIEYTTKLKERIEELKKDNSCKNCGCERIGCGKDCFQSESDEDLCDCGEKILVCDSGMRLCSVGCKDKWVYSNGDEC